MADRKLRDNAHEKFYVRYFILNGHEKKFSNYIRRNSFRTWSFPVYFAGIKFLDFAEKM